MFTRPSTQSLIIASFIVLILGGAFYWIYIRPAQARMACQAEVEEAFKKELWNGGHFQNSRGEWVHGQTICNWVDDPSKNEDPNSAVCRLFGHCNQKCESERVVQKTNRYTIEDANEVSEVVYKPCLRRHGLSG